MPPETVTEPWPPPWARVRDAAAAKAQAAYFGRMTPEHQTQVRDQLAALPNWWGECIEEWQTAQQLLTDAGVPVGRGAQAGSNLDTRVAEFVVPALARLGRIAEAHHKRVDEHGGTDGLCAECGWVWPCPTRVWATGERDGSLDCWDPRDDEEADHA